MMHQTDRFKYGDNDELDAKVSITLAKREYARIQHHVDMNSKYSIYEYQTQLIFFGLTLFSYTFILFLYFM